MKKVRNMSNICKSYSQVIHVSHTSHQLDIPQTTKLTIITRRLNSPTKYDYSLFRFSENMRYLLGLKGTLDRDWWKEPAQHSQRINEIRHSRQIHLPPIQFTVLSRSDWLTLFVCTYTGNLLSALQCLAVSYRSVSDTFFEYRGKYRKNFQSIGIVSGKNQNPILSDQYYLPVTLRSCNSARPE